ncbi:hypothetical protein BJ741DRAFT_617438 [Chytriomyces cf. hyalinus JEL632]|nr:hypothetical protein BJ741DRAFT_617438 [Chytriomyces cf. hyalinus JEL632]
MLKFEYSNDDEERTTARRSAQVPSGTGLVHAGSAGDTPPTSFSGASSGVAALSGMNPGLLKFDRYPQTDGVAIGTFSHAAIGFSNDDAAIVTLGGQSQSVVESVAGIQVVVAGGRNGQKAKPVRVFERFDRAPRKMGSVSSEDFSRDRRPSSVLDLTHTLRRSTSFLFQCFDPLSSVADDYDENYDVDGSLSARPPQPVLYYPDPTPASRPYDEAPPVREPVSSASGLIFEPYELGKGHGRSAPKEPKVSLAVKAAALLVLPRSSSLTSSVLSTKSVMARVFRQLQPTVAQRLSRVNKMWRSCAAEELSRNIITVELSWETSMPLLGKWTGFFIKDLEYQIDESISILQLCAWTFDFSLGGGKQHPKKQTRKDDKSKSTLPSTIPAHNVCEIAITFPVVPMSAPALPLTPQFHAVPIPGSASTNPYSCVFSRNETHFATSNQQSTKEAVSGTDVIFSKNCGIFFGHSGSVDMVRVGVAPGNVHPESEAAPVSISYDLERVKKSVTLFSRERWTELMRYEAEVLAMSKTVLEKGAKTPLQHCFDSCAVRNYLSCPEDARIWAFKQVLVTLLSPNNETLSAGMNELSAALSKMDKVAHRVDILQMLDVPYNQRRERLSEYYLDAWKVWMGLCPGEGSRATDLMDVEDDEGLFEEIDLLVSGCVGDATGASVRCPVGGGISLRLSGYSGSLKDYEAVYRHLQNVLLPEFV